jgi:hypothetical protein
MNVSGKNSRETARDRATGNHVRMPAEHIVHRTDRCALDGLMKTKKTYRGSKRSPSGLRDERGERSLDSVALAGEPRDRDIDATDIEGNRSRTIEDVDAAMHGQERIRNRGSLMVPRNDDDRHAGVRNVLERLERAHHQPGFDSTPKEHVPAVDDQIHVAREGRTQGAFVTREEVTTGQPEVRIGEKKNADHAKSVERGRRARLRPRVLPGEEGAAIHGEWIEQYSNATRKRMSDIRRIVDDTLASDPRSASQIIVRRLAWRC